MKMRLFLENFIPKDERNLMSKKERSFNVELQEISDINWSVIVSSKKRSQTVAHISKLDEHHYEVEQVSTSVAPKVVVNSLDEALNSALMQFNLHLH
ncbi:hypothetical protein DS831_07495 [Bombilactobacillus bombi]|uniref:Uncharacterized protein n=2 Tax=Bombilactobacillus bombi TaxID=1303590 RepID=A0A347SRL6_9LACO|nr:DUF2969 family protein [Bombilactobacillus bombi]RHW49996.1 hypothetical protein DS831_07495 [Bombilactobacillus bombi]